MSTIVKAAAVQISPVLYSRQGTIEKVAKKIHELGTQGVQFATFPEAVVPYYPYFSYVQSAFDMRIGKEHQRLLEESVTVPSAETHAIGEAAKEFAATLEVRVAYEISETLDAAVPAAARDAEASGLSDAVVLLSPACASFDQFSDFEQRGDAFRAAVEGLVRPAARGARA